MRGGEWQPFDASSAPTWEEREETAMKNFENAMDAIGNSRNHLPLHDVFCAELKAQGHTFIHDGFDGEILIVDDGREFSIGIDDRLTPVEH